MALVESERPWYLSVRLAASNAKTTTKRYNLVAANATEAAAAATEVRTRLLAASAGVIVSYTIEQKFVEDAFALPTSDDAEWGEEAILSGKIEGSPLEAATARIPFPKIGLFQGASGAARDTIDIADSAVLGYWGIFVEANAIAYTSDGEYAGLLEKGSRV